MEDQRHRLTLAGSPYILDNGVACVMNLLKPRKKNQAHYTDLHVEQTTARKPNLQILYGGDKSRQALSLCDNQRASTCR